MSDLAQVRAKLALRCPAQQAQAKGATYQASLRRNIPLVGWYALCLREHGLYKRRPPCFRKAFLPNSSSDQVCPTKAFRPVHRPSLEVPPLTRILGGTQSNPGPDLFLTREVGRTATCPVATRHEQNPVWPTKELRLETELFWSTVRMD